jgi:hypothetical protein
MSSIVGNKAARTRPVRASVDRFLVRRSRRAFLQGAGGVLVGLPLLEFTREKQLAAQTKGQKRLLILSLGHSMDVAGSYDERNLVPGHSGGDLTSMSPILEPLASRMGQLSFVDKVDNLVAQSLSSNGHNASGRTVLSYTPHIGAAFNTDGSLSDSQGGNTMGTINENPPSMYTTGPSIHYDLGRRMGYTPLNLRVGGDNGEHARDFYVSTDSSGQEIIQRDAGQPDPQRAFDDLFGSLTASDQELSPVERLRAKRGSVLDSVLEDFDRVMSEVGSVDRERLERHADHIRQAESSIQTTVQIVCDNPTLSLASGLPDSLTSGDGRSDDLITAAHFELIATTFACQATPLAHLHFSNMQNNKFPFLNDGEDMFESGETSNWHAAVHHDDGDSAEAQQRRLVAMRWYAQLLDDMVGRLEAVPEGDGTLMDNTLIVWISSLRYSSHETSNLPTLLVGDLNGQLQTGRFIDLKNHGTGGTLGDVWCSVANAMLMDDLSNGWDGAPLNAFGHNVGDKRGRAYNNGPIPGWLVGT